jgi:hypothetical protein
LLATLASALLVIVGSVVVGRALTRALGWRRVTWIEPAVGFALLAVAASASTRLLGGGTAAAVVLGAIVVAALALLRLRVLPLEELRVAAPVALLAGAFASLPLIASQRVGALGVGINNDLAGHLLWAQWLQSSNGPEPLALVNGYPVGPHSIAAAIGEALGFPLIDVFVGMMIGVAALTALTALALLRELPPARRALACALVALPYLIASSLAVGGFKETIMALLIVGSVAALARVGRDGPPDLATAVSLGVLAAGSISVYSYPGLTWVLLTAALLAILGGVRAARAGRLRAAARRFGALAAAAAVVGVVLASTEIPRAVDFHDRSGVEHTLEGSAKLDRPVSPLEALGAWPDSNFLAGIGGPPLVPLFGALGLAALAVSLPWWLRRGPPAVPASVLAAAAVYAGTVLWAGIYVQSKVLAVAAPLVMLVVAGALLDPRSRAAATGGWRWAWTGLAAAFVTVAAYSSFVALRDAVVAPGGHAAELAAIRDRVRGDWVLYLTGDRFTDFDLDSTRVASPFRNAQIVVPSRPGKDYVLPLDFDSVQPEALDRFRWVLTTAAAYRSEPPPNLRLVLDTPSYQLWKRVGPTPLDTRVLAEGGWPGLALDCDPTGPVTREPAPPGAVARVFLPGPAVRPPESWEPTNELAPGDAATNSLTLGPGPWELSIQYLSPLHGLTVRVGDRSFTLPPSVDGAVAFRRGPLWRLGRIDSPGGTLPVTVRVNADSALQRLLGVARPALIGRIAATRARPDATMPLTRACGRYVDHYSIGAGNVDPAAVRHSREIARLALRGDFRPPEMTRPQASGPLPRPDPP